MRDIYERLFVSLLCLRSTLRLYEIWMVTLFNDHMIRIR